MNGEKKSDAIRGFKFRTASYLIMVFAMILIIATSIGSWQTSVKYNQLINSTELYILLQKNIYDLQQTLEFRCEKARQYVVTKDRIYLDRYCDEVDEIHTREKTISEIRMSLRKTDVEVDKKLDKIIEVSNEMIDMEIHAMKLIATYKEENVEKLSSTMQNYKLLDVENKYPKENLPAVANSLLFGTKYGMLKQIVEDSIKTAIEEISNYTTSEQQSSADALHNVLTLQRCYIGALFGVIILLILLNVFFVIRPIYLYITCIEEEKEIETKGFFEFRYLAAVYNKVSEMNAVGKVMLQHKAEHDALTGLLNRAGFDKIREYLKSSVEPLAMLLIDVDLFKQVNDNYGHEIGDQALQKVANLLKEQFRSDDYPMRIGGDEFAVIMTKVLEKDRDIVSGKIQRMNEILSHSENGIPPLSVSVGIVFSEMGYKDDMFNQADQALYQTKKNGRHGFTFYEDITEKV